MYSLSENNLVSVVKYVSPLGIIDTKEKICLKCTHCRTNDKYDMFGTKKAGYSFYPMSVMQFRPVTSFMETDKT